MATSADIGSRWKKCFLPSLCLLVLVALALAFLFRPYLGARYLVLQLSEIDEASLSRITLDVDVNTYDHDLPEWCVFELKEATFTMLRTRFGQSAIKSYVLDRPEGTFWTVVPIDTEGAGPHYFQVAGGRGNDSVFYVLRHEPGTFDTTGMRLIE